MEKFILLFYLITLPNNLFSQKNFEGAIKFKTEIYSNDKNFEQKLEKKYGDSVIVSYFENGDFKREYLNAARSGNYIQNYDSNKGLLYLRYRNTSKVDTLNTKVNSIVRLKSKKKIGNETIMGLDCECYEYTGVSTYGDDVIINYCFSNQTPKVDSKHFEKHVDFFIYDFFQESQRPYLKFVLETQDFKITQTATEITKLK